MRKKFASIFPLPLRIVGEGGAKRRVRVVVGVIALLVVAFFLFPLPRSLGNGSDTTLRILDRHGTLLYEHRGASPGSHDFLALQDIPTSVTRALISVEDRSFYRHGGVSIKAIARALWQNLSTGDVVSGGSTITQQLIRVASGNASRSYVRKAVEAIQAIKLDLFWSKDRILETYLNRAYFGHQAYGIEAASRTYLGKDARELSTAEAAYLIGLLQSPSGYDPFTHEERAIARQKIVLAAMEDTGAIPKGTGSGAAAVPVRLKQDKVQILAPHFVFWVLSRPDLPASGDVVTTLDLPLQQEVERSVANQLERLKDEKVGSAAVVVLDAKTGDVLAMVGSHDYFDAANDGAVNVAVSARQPGSALKPFTYALALEKGDTAATTVADVMTQFLTAEGTPYTPRNYDFDEHGLVRYRESLSNSYNIAAVKVLQKVGVESLLTLLKNAGITTLTESAEHYGLALTLGDAEVRLLELTRAYGAFARGGVTLTERSVMSDPIPRGNRILSPETSWLISDILSDPVARLPQFGENGPLTFPYPVAAKTGTTRNSRDNWTLGFTTQRVVGVWVGNIDNSPMRGTSGVTGAGPIFHDVMNIAMEGIPKEPFPKPNTVHAETICTLSGLKASPDCPGTMQEWFKNGTEPAKTDDVYVTADIDMRTGLRANAQCPAQYVVHRTFAVLPPEVREWGRHNGYVPPPSQVSPLCGGGEQTTEGENWIRITQPSDGDTFLLDPLVPDADENVTFSASAGTAIQSIDWYVDGAKIEAGTAPDFRVQWKPREGSFTVTAKGGGKEEKIKITVTRRHP